MLVLTRKAGESIVIEGGITVTVLSIDRGKIRIGITAPPDVRVDREEIFQRRQEWAESGAEKSVLAPAAAATL
jgi:carbon storage regulator